MYILAIEYVHAKQHNTGISLSAFLKRSGVFTVKVRIKGIHTSSPIWSKRVDFYLILKADFCKTERQLMFEPSIIIIC